ncbi:MAG: bifunctional lysine ketoglutarate reductase /saccharopine dehydrogenase family protein [Acidobacteriota bacterium]
MNKIIGIRREDKNKWERRTPLIPDDVRELREKFGIRTIVQPSKLRIFTDDEYREAGAEINESLNDADVIFAVKEIPEEFYMEGKTYIFFSHTIKGQSYNMDMLQKMIEKKVNLIDYEKIVDENNRRLIFFGKYAGLAGMVETLHAMGQKLKLQGFDTPLERIKQAFEYNSVEEAKSEIAKIGEEINENGFPQELSPFVIGFAGYGNVSRGAQEIFDLLPHKTVSIDVLDENYENFIADNYNFYKVVFKEEDMVSRVNGEFELNDYYNNPDKYVSKFENYIPKLKVLVNCIYWTEKYPRLVTREYLENESVLHKYPNMRVIGDISCDINGSVEITHKVTMPDNPSFTYFAGEDRFEDGVKRGGVSVMAVDNLPCEFPKESSREFSKVLKVYVNNICQENFGKDFDSLNLPGPIKSALILHNGKFTPDYTYIKKYLQG